jgi:hypothetical protein
MTHEQLIEFAKQSAPDFTQYNEFFCTLHDFKRFAALVAAAERDACTELLLEIKRKCQDADRLWQIEEFVDEAIRARGKA